jgi:hypothetical protein
VHGQGIALEIGRSVMELYGEKYADYQEEFGNA